MAQGPAYLAVTVYTTDTLYSQGYISVQGLSDPWGAPTLVASSTDLCPCKDSKRRQPIFIRFYVGNLRKPSRSVSVFVKDIKN